MIRRGLDEAGERSGEGLEAGRIPASTLGQERDRMSRS
jgi:hypothetical protein